VLVDDPLLDDLLLGLVQARPDQLHLGWGMLLGHYLGMQSVCLVSKLPYLGSTETGMDALGVATKMGYG